MGSSHIVVENWNIFRDGRVDSRLYPGEIMAAPMIYPSIQGFTPPPFCDLVRCLRIPESTPPSQNRPFLFNKCICETLQESTPPSQNIPPLFNNYMQPSENIIPF